MNCKHCGSSDMRFAGTQENVVRGTEFDMYECQNSDCPRYQSSISYNERLMPQGKIDEYVRMGLYNLYHIQPPAGA